LLFNVALHGLEEAAGVRYQGHDEARVEKDSPVLIRYADDFAVCCHTRQQAEQVKARLEGWLAGRGMSINEDKTRIVHLTQGFDFLGWTIRRYRNGKLLIKPSRKAVRKHRDQLAEKMRKLRGSNAMAVIATLSPVVRLDGLPPVHGLQQDVPLAGRLHVEAHLEMGAILASE